MDKQISLEALIELVQQSTVRQKICTPCNDFYRRSGDWVEDSITYIDADTLLFGLQKTMDSK